MRSPLSDDSRPSLRLSYCSLSESSSWIPTPSSRCDRRIQVHSPFATNLSFALHDCYIVWEQVAVNPASQGSVTEIDLEVSSTSGSLILHWGALCPDRR
jgi:hypothetical protein